MKNNKRLLGFVLILSLFLVTRLYKINEIPPTVYWDEASIGYNAYAISTHLIDEWGDKLPLHFRAFGEFKLPVYIYTTSFFVKLFGLSTTTIRLPAVLYSLGILFFTYLLIRKVIGKDWIGIISSLLLCISPWFFVFSRTGYEATAGLFFFLLGTYLLLQVARNKFYFLFATLSFILSFYSYNSFRIIIPIWFVVLLGFMAADFKKAKRYWVVLAISLFIFVISLIPVWKLIRYDAGSSRLAVVSLERKSDFFKNYFSHFSPEFLFFKGDGNSRSQIPGHGQLYLIEAPFVFLGVWVILKSKKNLAWLPLLMLLIAPIPAALTRESPHALRSILMAPSFSFVSAIGIGFALDKFRRHKSLIIFSIIMVFSLSFRIYMSDFISNYSKVSSKDWQYGYREIFLNYQDEIKDAKKVVISDEYGQPYIFALYYQKFDIDKFRRTAVYNDVSNWGFSTISSFDKFEFKKIGMEDFKKGNLIFVTGEKPPTNLEPNSKIQFLDGIKAFDVYKL